MTAATAYASVEDVREWLGDTDGNLNELLLERACSAASRAIDAYCGRRFWADATLTERTYRPADPEIALVDDISTMTGLVVKTDTSADGSWATTWDSGDWQAEPLNAAAAAEGAVAWWQLSAVGTKRFPVGGLRPGLAVTARFGWSAVPDDVATAAILKAVSLFKRKEAPFGVAGFGEFGAVRISRRDPDVTELLGPYLRLATPDL